MLPSSASLVSSLAGRKFNLRVRYSLFRHLGAPRPGLDLKCPSGTFSRAVEGNLPKLVLLTQAVPDRRSKASRSKILDRAARRFSFDARQDVGKLVAKKTKAAQFRAISLATSKSHR